MSGEGRLEDLGAEAWEVRDDLAMDGVVGGGAAQEREHGLDGPRVADVGEERDGVGGGPPLVDIEEIDVALLVFEDREERGTAPSPAARMASWTAGGTS